MAIQDLTPQLRTRLSRVERAVGFFVLLAVIILVTGFVYYVYETGKRRGWFITKMPYYTYVVDATGLRPGDPVRLMGFDVGEIVEVEATPAANNWYITNEYNVFIKFRIRKPYYGYIWSDSRTKIQTGDLLGSRALEVTKGSTGLVTVIEEDDVPVEMLNDTAEADEPDYVAMEEQPQGYWLKSDEAPALTERFDQIANQVQEAVPKVLAMTNEIAKVLSNSTELTRRLNTMTAQAEPMVTNLVSISAMLNQPKGALGEWLLPSDVHRQLENTLASASSTLSSSETNLNRVAENLNENLVNLASITSNLNAQVERNGNILSELSQVIVDANAFIQGLKQHWLLRSAFKDEEQEEKQPGDGQAEEGRPQLPQGPRWQR